MRLVDRLRAMSAATAKTELEAEYRALLTKAHAAGGDLDDDAGARRLMELAEGLSVSIGDIEGDLAALGRAAELRARSARVSELEAAHVKAVGEHQRATADHNKVWEALAEKRDEIARRVLKAGGDLADNTEYSDSVDAFRRHLSDDGGRVGVRHAQGEVNRLKAELDKSRAALRFLDELVRQHPRVLSPADTLPPSAPSPEPQPKASAEPKSDPTKP